MKRCRHPRAGTRPRFQTALGDQLFVGFGYRTARHAQRLRQYPRGREPLARSQLAAGNRAAQRVHQLPSDPGLAAVYSPEGGNFYQKLAT